jgi:hypothetical protein
VGLLLLGCTQLTFGCRTPGAAESSAAAGLEGEGAAVAAGTQDSDAPSDEEATSAGGYFVAVPADAGSPKVLAFYDKLYDAIDALNRRRARDEGRLDAYLDEQRESGYTALQAGDDEIECDRQKCLVKLTARTVVGESSLAHQLVDAAVELGIKPLTARPGRQEKRYILGDVASMHIDCLRAGVGKTLSYRCDFKLDQGLATAASPSAAIGDAGRGKLSSCAMAPGTVRDAEEAKAQLDKGGLLPLTGGPSVGSKVVGYLRYAQTGAGIELLDMYLCGDLSQDHFQIDGEARQPRRWIKARVFDALSLDEAALNLRTKVLESSKREFILDVRFRVVPSGGNTGEAFGEDKFFMRLDKGWL